MVIGGLIRNTAARLQDKRGCHVARSALHMKKLGTGLETSDGRHRLGTAGLHADRRLRPLALRRASTLRPPLVAMRARNPWRRFPTGRDGWELRFTAASLLARFYRSEGCSGVRNPAAYRVPHRLKSIDPGEFMDLSRFGSRVVTKHHNGAKDRSLCLWPLPTLVASVTCQGASFSMRTATDT